MIGTLIGDLAAWTYEHDKNMFYKQLIPVDGEGTELSVYGKALLNAASHNLLTCPWISVEPIGSPQDRIQHVGQWLMWQIVSAWTDKEQMNAMPKFHTYKEEWYAKKFITRLVRLLRKGYTKSEAYHSVPFFKDLSKSWKWKIGDTDNKTIGLLAYIFRGWDSFYRAFDYTSTIHNAVRWPGDSHLTAAIAGTFADAMYGCEMSFIKKKYAGDNEPYHFLNVDLIGERNGYHHGLIHEMASCSCSCRTFYPKNNALTNVERHHWKPVLNVYRNVHFTEEEHGKVLLSARTGWENRYGMYLDDGWIYVYRSHCLLGRFQMENDASSWYIKDLQLSGEESFKMLCLAIDDALYASSGLRMPEISETTRIVRSCKYFNGELESPQEWEHQVNGKFWHGEMMLIQTSHNFDEWVKSAENLSNELKGDRKKKFLSYTPDQRGILLYIEELFAKWCPYDDLEWIFQY